MQLQEDRQHHRQNGQESQEQLTKLLLCCFLTRDQYRWRSQQFTCLRKEFVMNRTLRTETDDETQQ